MSTEKITSPTSLKISNSRVKVDESPQSFGRGFIATESVPGGSLLLRLDPLISVLETALLNEACSACFVPSKTVDEAFGKDLMKCTGCKQLRYCSKQCQRKDWKTHHAKECKYLQLNPTTDPPPSLIRGVMRLINLYSGDEKNLGFAEDVVKLQSHIEKEEKMKRWEEIEELSQGINRITTKIGGKPLSEDGVRGIQQLCCKFLVNSMTLVTSSFDELGMTFDPTLALLNHSCNPNAAVVFDRNMASVRSIRDIKSGEQITISYIDNTFKRATRRQQLRNQYFFDCRCEGCEPPNNEFTGRDSWLCESCKALIPETLLQGDFKCPQCKKVQSTNIDTLRSLEAKASSILELSTSSNQPPLSLLNEVLLPTLQSLTSCASWPPIRQPAPALRHQTYTICLSIGNLEAAYHHMNTLTTSPLLDLHPEPFHPLKTVQIFTTASLIASLAANENSVDYLKRAWELMRLSWGLSRGSHGENSEFAQRIAKRRGEVERDLAMGGEDIRNWMRIHSG